MINTIRLERAKLGISQRELAEIVGCTSQHIHHVEKGKARGSLLWAMKVAQVFKVKVDDIFKLEKHEYIETSE